MRISDWSSDVCSSDLLGWQRKQFEGGWAGVSWPVEYGGRGLSLTHQLIWYEEYAKAGGPNAELLFVGCNHAAPTIMARGTDEQKSYHLPKILSGEVAWCQGFSEPNNGSDLGEIGRASCRERVCQYV